MKVLCVFGKYQYGDRSRGVGIEYESFIPALQRLGYTTRHFETWDKDLYPTYADLNYALLAVVDAYRPDIVFTVQRDYEIWIETLTSIQDRGKAALVTWTTDDSFNFHRVSKYIGHHYDAISTTYDYRVKDYRDLGIEGVYATQWASNSHWLNRPKPAQDCKYSISFIGAAYGSRPLIVEKLKHEGILVACFGHGWPNGSIETAQIPHVMRDSVISLNFSAGFLSDSGSETQVKARTFEVPGAGGFLLTDSSPGLDKLYRVGQEIVIYSGFDDLVSKIRHYLTDLEGRDRVACAGHSRTVAEHTYERRLGGLFKFAILRRNARLETKRKFSVASRELINPEISRHNASVPLALFGWALVKLGQAIWGRDRGPKAARRLVFEVSRRVLGAKTFSATSLPGRMFPYV